MSSWKKTLLSQASSGSYWILTVGDNSTSTTCSQGTWVGNDDVTYFTVRVSGISPYPFQFMQIDSDGTVLADKTVVDTGNFYTYAICTDSSDNVYCFSARDDLNITKLNSSFVKQWSYSYPDQYAYGQPGDGRSIDVDSSGNVYFSGYGFDNNSWNSIFIGKANSSGTFQWAKRIGTTSQTDRGTAISVRSDGAKIAQAGQFYNGGNRAAAIMQWNSDGTLDWQSGVRDTSNNAFSYFAEYDSSDNVYTGGYARGSYYQAFVAKFNSSGTRQWCTAIRDGNNNTYSYGGDTDPDGNTYLAVRGNGPDPGVVKLDSSGSNVWGYSIAHADATTAGNKVIIQACKVCPSGDVVATGYFTDSSNTRAFVWRIPADGPSTGTFGDWTISSKSYNVLTGPTNTPSGQGTGTFNQPESSKFPTVGNRTNPTTLDNT
jgi:hypothetical protein